MKVLIQLFEIYFYLEIIIERFRLVMKTRNRIVICHFDLILSNIRYKNMIFIWRCPRWIFVVPKVKNVHRLHKQSPLNMFFWFFTIRRLTSPVNLISKMEKLDYSWLSMKKSPSILRILRKVEQQSLWELEQLLFSSEDTEIKPLQINKEEFLKNKFDEGVPGLKILKPRGVAVDIEVVWIENRFHYRTDDISTESQIRPFFEWMQRER